MGKDSKIEWTDCTFNPWWGCTKVSPGCANCYAETFSKRTGNDIWGPVAPRRFFGEKHWNEPLKWNRDAEKQGRRKRVFCASMADVFEGRDDLKPWRKKAFDLMQATPWLDYLVLTKRPEDIVELTAETGHSFDGTLRNVWLGTSAEDQRRWDERVPELLSIPASVHFVSAEPLLGPIRMGRLNPDWLIVGGESGPGARCMDPDWVRSLRDDCDERPTAFLFKQWGGVRKEKTGRELDGRTWDEYPKPRYAINL